MQECFAQSCPANQYAGAPDPSLQPLDPTTHTWHTALRQFKLLPTDQHLRISLHAIVPGTQHSGT